MSRCGLILVLVTVGALPASAATRERQWVANGPFGGTVTELEVDPNSPSTLYAGTIRAGVFKSTDGGRTWKRRNAGLPPDVFVTGLEMAPSDPATLYLQLNAENVLYASTDATRRWRRLPTVHPSFEDFAVHPTDAKTVFLAGGDWLLRSSDGGATWSRLPGPYQPDNVAVARSAPNVIYADSNGFVLRSSDGGLTWTRLQFPISNFDVFEVDPRDANTFYVSAAELGLYKSTDGGVTSTRILRDRSIEHLAVDPRDTRRIYAASRGEAFLSANGGSTWTKVSSGLPGVALEEIEVDGSNAATVYAGVENRGIFKTLNGGRRWTSANRGLTAAGIATVAVHPRAPRIAYAGTWGVGVWRTTDGGRHWSPAGLGGRVVRDLAFDPTTPRRIYAAADDAFFRTENAGRHWRKLVGTDRNSGARAVGVVLSAPRIVYASTFAGATYRSTNRGTSWRKLRLVREPRRTTVTSFAFHPRRPGTLWVGTATDKVLRSTDGGRTWRESAGHASWGEIRTLVLSPSNPRVIYVAASESGVYRSADGGATWRAANVGLSGPLGAWPIFALEIDRRNPRLLYAAGYHNVNGGHVYRSTNGARTWTDITGAMPSRLTYALGLSSDNRILYAGTGTYGGGGGVVATKVK